MLGCLPKDIGRWTRLCPIALAACAFGAALSASRADSISGTGWKGKGADNNWTTSNNWDNTPPKTDGSGDRNLFFGNGYVGAGNDGFTTSNNNLNSWAGYRITFQNNASAPAFTISGNGFSLFSFDGNFPRIENDASATQTFNLTSGETITLDGGGTGKSEINPVNGNITFSAGTKIALNSFLDIFGNSGKTLTFNDVVSGGSGLGIQQNSTVVMNAANTYSGGTFINAGTLQIGSGGTTGSLSTSSAITDNGNLTFNRSNAVVQGTDFSGSAITGSGSLTQAGSGTLTLNAANTYGGGTNINNGTVQFAKINAMPATGAITVATGAMLAVNAGAASNEWTSGSSGAGTIAGLVSGFGQNANQITWNGGSNLGIDTTNAVGGTFTLGTSIRNFRSDAGTRNDVGLTKLGTGVLILNPSLANLYTGTTQINGGTLRLGADNIIDASSPMVLADVSGATFDLNGKELAVASIAGGGASGGNVTLGSGTFVISGSSNTNYAGVISGTGSVVKQGAGTQIFSGSNSYAGNTVIMGGTLSGNSVSDAASDSAFGKGNFTISSGATLQYTGSTAATDRTITLNSGGGTIEVTNAGTKLTSSAQIGGAGGLTKTGSGTLVLTANNNYSGGTTINGGTLQADNATSSTGTGTVTVNADGTLSGTGKVTGSVNLAGTGASHQATLAPGHSVGTLAIVGTLTFNADSRLLYEINSTNQVNPAADLVNVTGDVEINAGAKLELSDTPGLSIFPNKLTVIAYTGALLGAGEFDGHPQGSQFSFGGTTYEINYADSSPGVNGVALSNVSYITLSAVPEASVVVFGMLLCAALALRRGGRRGI
jgi:autotransporter-associated beta strand protein